MEVANTRNHSSKRKHDDTVSSSNGFNNNNNNNNVDLSLLEAIEKSQNTIEVVDNRTLKKLVLSFERRLKENIEARLKYPNQPDRFADSELELHEELHKLKVLAGAP
ncbi:beta-catenin-like protein 1-like, partial [Trifolium medium]|nr:beta-catenin-like protein 1-like [Trifolium medium]